MPDGLARSQRPQTAESADDLEPNECPICHGVPVSARHLDGCPNVVARMEPPVRLCCGQRHAGPVCPDGKVMCELCFDRFPQDGLYVDENGDRWDVCTSCGQRDAEQSSLRQR